MADEREIDGFLAKYSPKLAIELQAARRGLAEFVPRGYELIYDNYNALVFGFGPTERASDAVLSVAGYPNWVTLFFLKGAALPDPDGLLQGKGSKVRSIRLESPDVLQSKVVAALIKRALAKHAAAFENAPRLRSVIKSVSATQRPRRPATLKVKAKAAKAHRKAT